MADACTIAPKQRHVPPYKESDGFDEKAVETASEPAFSSSRTVNNRGPRGKSRPRAAIISKPAAPASRTAAFGGDVEAK